MEVIKCKCIFLHILLLNKVGSKLSLHTPVNEFDAAKFHRSNSLWDISANMHSHNNRGLQVKRETYQYIYVN